MGANVRTAPQVRALTASLRAAARSGWQAHTDRDRPGGRARPALPLGAAGGLGRGAGAARPRRRSGVEGERPRTALERLGVDVDLAPVADVPGVPGSFIAAQRRGFSTIPHRAAKGVTAFAAGLLDGGAAPTLKHFPGLGLATVSTDDDAVTIDAGAAALAPGLVPYRRAIAAGVVPLVMVSNASYTRVRRTRRPRGRLACSRCCGASASAVRRSPMRWSRWRGRTAPALDGDRDPGRRGRRRPAALRRLGELDRRGLRRAARSRPLGAAASRGPRAERRRIEELAATYAG